MADKGITDACLNNDSLEVFSVVDLKNYLSNHGQPVSGNKTQLIERVKGTNRLGLVDLNVTKARDDIELSVRKINKLKTPQGEILQHPFKLKKWNDDLSNVPDFSQKDIYNYIVLKMNCKKQLKSRVFYEDGHVHSVQLCEIDENSSHCYVRCKVLPSLPTANKKDTPEYNVWVMMLKVTGCINSAECNCTAGEGEACNHIAALLYAIADITEKKISGKLAPTSQKCKWNNPRKRKLSPKKAENVSFKKYSFDSESSVNRSAKVFDIHKSTVNVSRFHEKLISKNLKAGWLTNFVKNTDKKENTVSMPKLHNINFQFANQVDLKNESCISFFKSYFGKLALDEAECLTIEQLSRQQSESDNWQSARKERLTASNFGKVVKRRDCTEPDSLLKDLFGYRSFWNQYIEFGRKHEAAARKTYIHQMKKSHPGLTVKQSGLIVNTKFPHLGASPDGLVYCACEKCRPHGHGLVEIKCPASMQWRMLTPQECAKDGNFFCHLNEQGEVILKENHDYYFQVQGQMAITGRKWCDFVVWTCSGIASIQRIWFNEELWINMLSKLNKFYVAAFIPEMFSGRVMRGLKLFP